MKIMVIEGQGHLLNQGQMSIFMYFPCIYTFYIALEIFSHIIYFE